MAFKHPAAASLRLARLTLLLLAVLPLLLAAAPKPAWWTARGAVNAQQPADDYAIANLGQLKHMASKARDELNSALLNQGGAGPAIEALIASFGVNLARLPGVLATQSSTFNDPAVNPSAAKAIDGNTEGNYARLSVARTSPESSPWWQIDLGASRLIQSVEVWNRTDSYSGLLTNFYVLVSDTDMRGANLSAPRSLSSLLADGAIWKSPKVTTFPAPNLRIDTGNRTGRYVMIRLEGLVGLQSSLQLAEVKVRGVTNTGAPPADDFAAATLGQLKAVARPFYDRLYAAGYKTSYPWLGREGLADDLAIANLGQLKNLFSFDLGPLDSTRDTNSNKVPDWWEHLYMGRLIAGSNAGPAADQDNDGVSDIQEYLAGSNPNTADTDGDGLSDAEEAAAGTNPNSSDTDGDGVKDKLDLYPTDKRRSAAIPILRYASIDVSTPITQSDEIKMVAIDDSNKVGFTRSTLQGTDSYSVPPGATGSSAIKRTLPSDYGHSIEEFVYHDIGRETDLELVLVEDYKSTVKGVNASGHLAVDAQVKVELYRKRNEKIDRGTPSSPPQGPIPGMAEYEFPVTITTLGGAFAWTGGKYPKLTRESVQPHLTYTTPNYRYYANGITNQGTLWGRDGEDDFNTFIGTAFFNRGDMPGFIFILSENAAFAAGRVKNNIGAAYARCWKLNSFYSIFDSSDTETEVKAIDNDGEILGFSPKFSSSSYFSHLEPLAQHAFWFSGGAAGDFYSALPEVFRQQVAFLSSENTVGSSSQGGRPTLMNSMGDLLFTAAVADTQADTPVWRRALLLWTRARNGSAAQLNEVELPKDFGLMQMNSRLALGGLLAKPVLNADGTPKPDPGNPSQPLKTNRAALLFPVEMMVDANRDGEMSFTDAAIHNKDDTTADKPYRFWLNDDYDAPSQNYPMGEDHPDSVTKDHANNIVESWRDLEDVTRIWISFKGIIGMVKSQGFGLQLEWKPIDGGTSWTPAAGSPAIKVYKAVEPDGGKAYVEDEGWAQQQLVNPYNTAYGQAGKGAPLLLPLSQVTLANLTESNPNLYLLFEGVTSGKGQLVLNLIKGGQKIGEYPPLYLDLRDIKSMYQRQDLTGKNQWASVPFVAAPDEANQAIVFVHGWNMSPKGAENFAESMFKRLWWRGYKGRFGAIRWDTFYSDKWQWVPHVGGAIDAYLAKYNDSEHIAWMNADGLKNFVASIPQGYSRNLVAHSMGNVVAGAALEKGMQVDNYALLQAAIPAAVYDERETLKQTQQYSHSAGLISFTMWDNITPDDDPDPSTRSLAYRGRLKAATAPNLVSFFLPRDFAVSYAWEINNAQTKPPRATMGPGTFLYKRNHPPGQKLIKGWEDNMGQIVVQHYITDPNEAEPYACRTWAKAVGAEERTTGAVDGRVNLDASFNFDQEHSAEFNFNIQKLTDFYNTLLDRLRIPRNQ